ncbi:helix-turn-helix domain-containing protein [Flavobacterium sp. UW10123]|uniref:helix-turn-helix domain-containing protein n=1 Tax=Flavobacterium sp. UW10123 TaxID=3230800 RepID=UPI0033972400
MSPRKNLFLLFLLFLQSFSFAQPAEKKLLKLSYEELHNLYFDNSKDPELQLKYANAYLEKANKENISIRKAKANYHLALIYYKTNVNKAIMYLDSVIKYSQHTKDPFFPAAAYCEKADFLKKKYKFKEAMKNYNLAEKVAFETNIDYYYVVREYIGITKSEDLGDYNEALTIFKECLKYYNNKDVKSSKYSKNYQSILFGLADCYKSLKNTDSTSFYNKLGYKESQTTKNEEYKYLFVLNEGANCILKRNYKAALDSIKLAIPKMIDYNNTGNVLAAYYYQGKAYEGLAQKSEAVKSFIKVDSMYRKTNEITNEFTDGYPYLISYYKALGDKENQLKYITTYMLIDSTLQKNYKELNKIVIKDYDTPHLISEKESLIKSMGNQQTIFIWGLCITLLTALIIAVLGIYQYKLQKKYRLRFEAIISESTEKNENKILSETSKETVTEIDKTIEIGIAAELVHQILEKLNRFEKEKKYLESNLTIQMLSNTFETNSKYVSKIVNLYKGKTFIQYINDLRIDYAISQLKKNSKLRKYTIHALALEFGFNNAESFSTVFNKKTGIKPSYFIKELDAETQS